MVCLTTYYQVDNDTSPVDFLYSVLVNLLINFLKVESTLIFSLASL
jgi:hypothetical protein